MRGAPLLFVVAACASSSDATVDASQPGPDAMGLAHDAATGTAARPVFVIPMENKPATSIYGNTSYAPYLNSLMATAASATNFKDELPSLDSEPHYIWMEAGTNVFPDVTFSTDNNPSASNSTASTAHLSAQLDAAGVPWTAYQEDIAAGKCPISSTGKYAPKHDPFVFFRDVSGSPPSATNANCAAHHKPYATLAADLQAGVSGLVFITPDLCHDMHGDSGCPSGTGTNTNITAGDTWLSQELPRIIAYARAHDGVIFLTWDEGNSTNLIPFVAIGNHVKVGTSSVAYTHSSLLRSIEELLGVAVLPSVASANDVAAMFEPGSFP